MITIRRFTDEDASGLAEVMLEMVAFYGTPIAVDGPLADDVLRQSRNVDIEVALADGKVVGFATYGFLYPVAGLRAFAYLHQLYVLGAYRRQGAARALMSAAARECLARGCDWMEWSTGRDNLVAQAMYEKMGATGSQKTTYRLTGDPLRSLAAMPG